MTIKKFKLFFASDIEKEERWLTEMSRQGLHFKKYKRFMYYFDEKPDESYIYQIDFREVDEDYFAFYKDAGWEHVNSFIERFHYFRAKADKSGVKKIYSDSLSVKESFQRMLTFYLTMFLLMVVSQLGLILTWNGYVIQVIAAVVIGLVFLLYLYIFISLIRKISFYRK